MSAWQWSLLAAGAVLVFWMVGGYNRLMAMRSALAETFRQIDDVVQQRAAVAEALAALARPALPTEQPALDAWQSAVAGARTAAQAQRQRPLEHARIAAWAAAETAVAASGARVLALLEQQPAVFDDASAAAHRATLREQELRLAFLRQQFNDGAGAYEQALALAPTHLLARLFRFGPLGRV